MVRSNERGVTLLELLVALTLLAIALVGLAASYPLAMYGVTTGGYQTTATLLAQQSIELTKSTSYGNVPTLATGVPVCDPIGGTGTYVAVTGYTGFTRCVSTQVATAGGAPTDTTTVVTVVVRFTSGGGENIDTRVATILSQ